MLPFYKNRRVQKMRKKTITDTKDNPTLAIIQKRLRECIGNSSFTQKIIAEKIGVSEQTVSKYMKSNVFPALDTLAKLCIVLDVSSDYILGLNDEY